MVSHFRFDGTVRVQLFASPFTFAYKGTRSHAPTVCPAFDSPPYLYFHASDQSLRLAALTPPFLLSVISPLGPGSPTSLHCLLHWTNLFQVNKVPCVLNLKCVLHCF